MGTEWKMERNNESRAYSNFNYFLDNKLMIFRNELCAKWMIILVPKKPGKAVEETGGNGSRDEWCVDGWIVYKKGLVQI